MKEAVHHIFRLYARRIRIPRNVLLNWERQQTAVTLLCDELLDPKKATLKYLSVSIQKFVTRKFLKRPKNRVLAARLLMMRQMVHWEVPRSKSKLMAVSVLLRLLLSVQ